jgi:hypothetical protein
MPSNPEPTLNAAVAIELDGEAAKSHEFFGSLYATTRYRVEADELREALERGHLDITVTVTPLESR